MRNRIKSGKAKVPDNKYISKPDYKASGIMNKSPSVSMSRSSKSPYGNARPGSSKKIIRQGLPPSNTRTATVDPEVRLEKTLLQIAEMKNQYYADKFSTEVGPPSPPEKKSSIAASQSHRKFISRPQTVSGDRLDSAKANSKIMKQLYLKNQQLEQEIQERGLEVNYDAVHREDELKQTIIQLKQEITEREMKLNYFNDNTGYIEFLKGYIEETQQDAQRIESSYFHQRKKLGGYFEKQFAQNSSDVAVKIRNNLDTEKLIRDEEIKIYKERLRDWKKQNQEYFIQREDLIQKLDAVREYFSSSTNNS